MKDNENVKSVLGILSGVMGTYCAAIVTMAEKDAKLRLAGAELLVKESFRHLKDMEELMETLEKEEEGEKADEDKGS